MATARPCGTTSKPALNYPNGWEGAQQTKMRCVAAHGGLIPDTDDGRARIRFVTEGEASLHALSNAPQTRPATADVARIQTCVIIDNGRRGEGLDTSPGVMN
ncbi:hypothetical protein DFH29DRAFT_84864 [Suillus ampliporus]|nr:hypothetical protein DFH29DRAFT_84864 [Suillus ampliporus]